ADTVAHALGKAQAVDERARLLENLAGRILLILAVDTRITVKPVGCTRHLIQGIADNGIETTATGHKFERGLEDRQRIATARCHGDGRSGKHSAVNTSSPV